MGNDAYLLHAVINLLLCSSAEHAVYALGGLDYQKLLAGHAPLKNTFSIAMEMEEVSNNTMH